MVLTVAAAVAAALFGAMRQDAEGSSGEAGSVLESAYGLEREAARFRDRVATFLAGDKGSGIQDA